ncbi:MAG: rod shape-determining protein MreC [Actinomycetota bacterium]|nr:rod shape-determining protein MreC [Actinomycetota bacterium]
MFDRHRARILLAVLTLVSLVLITVDERAGQSGPLAHVRDGLAAVFAPVQDGLATVVRPIGGVVAGVGDLLELRQENARLRAEVEQLRDRRGAYDDVARENRALQDLLDMRDRLTAHSDEFRFAAARVIALAPSNIAEWTITIDVGSRDGITRDMTVINGDGLVGRVVQVAPSASRVLLAIDQNFSAAARIAATGEHGLVEGRDTEPMKLELLNPEAEVEVGHEVVTSSYSNATFPDGIVIGAVSSEPPEIPALTLTVDVTPYVDFTRLTTVLVILRAPPPDPLPVPTPGTQSTSPPTPMATPTETPTLDPTQGPTP